MKINRTKIVNELKSKQNVVNAIDNGELAYGDSLNILEKELKSIFKKKYCVLTSNGFSSVFLSIKALGLENKNILVPAISSCFSFVNAIKASGNIPIFCDVEESSGNICISSAKSIFHKKGFDGIVSPNHIGVISCIDDLSQFSVPIIEDCAQSFLSNSEITSSATFQTFSFFPTKIANGIDGGAILTDDRDHYEVLKDIVYYRHQYSCDDVIRYNFKMQNINAAFLLGTLKSIDSFKEKIKVITKIYNTNLKDNFEIVNSSSKINHLFKYLIKFKDDKNCKLFLKEFNSLGVAKEFVFLTNDNSLFRKSSNMVLKTCSLPLYPDLKIEEVKLIIDKIKDIA